MNHQTVQQEYKTSLEERLTWREKKLAQADETLRKAESAFSLTATGEDLDRMNEAEGVVKAIQAAIETETEALKCISDELMGESV